MSRIFLLLVTLICFSRFANSQGIRELCRPIPGIDKGTCLKLSRYCQDEYNITLAWYGKPCRDCKGMELVEDAGCQCKPYCGFTCKSKCNQFAHCRWTKDGYCRTKAGVLAVHITRPYCQVDGELEYEIVTSTPSNSPTSVPTDSPTPVSTNEPTLEPTVEPTQEPTAPDDTVGPTNQPTESPTLNPNATDVDRFFHEYDLNRDGRISKEEICNVDPTNTLEQCAEQVASMDTNGDGFIDRTEAQTFIDRQP